MVRCRIRRVSFQFERFAGGISKVDEWNYEGGRPQLRKKQPTNIGGGLRRDIV
jgi:hypothetical protein